MARLNELVQPAEESVDALKRKFLRQNRELAKVNSTQSVRIRQLECDVSRLLAENVSLGEQIIKLRSELEENPTQYTWQRVDTIKRRLEAGLSDINVILQDLGSVRTKTRQDVRLRHKSAKSPAKQSPFARQSRKKPLSNDVIESLGGLPPIVEDKSYPRRTLDSNDIGRLIDKDGNYLDSPDLGPPPVAHFNETDSVPFGPLTSAPVPADQQARTAGSTNLEDSRNRRESEHYPKAKAAVAQNLKSGAKRKLTARHGEERESSHRSNVTHSRADNSDTSAPRDGVKTGPTIAKLANKKGELASKKDVPGSPRKVLGPKSANVDVQSPAKRARPGQNEKIRDAKEAGGKDKKGPRESISRRASGSVAPRAIVAAAAEIPASELPPKTPIGDPNDFFSPHTSEPSEPRPELRDTPPPPDLALGDSGNGSFGRASRRSRVSVSYAEPNLRDKMRRPTKEFVDAVRVPDGKSRKSSLSVLEADMARLRIKQEDDDDDEANHQSIFAAPVARPVSPLGLKPEQVQVQSKRRRSSILSLSDVNKKSSGSIFDFTGSDEDDSQPNTNAERNSRRRHSIMHTSSAPSDEQHQEDNDSVAAEAGNPASSFDANVTSSPSSAAVLAMRRRKSSSSSSSSLSLQQMQRHANQNVSQSVSRRRSMLL